MLREGEHLVVAAAVAVGPQLDVVVIDERAQPRRLLDAAAVRAPQLAGATPALVGDEARAQHVRDPQIPRDLVEVHVERRGDDHDFVTFAPVPRDPFAAFGGDGSSCEPGRELPSGRFDVGVGDAGQNPGQHALLHDVAIAATGRRPREPRRFGPSARSTARARRRSRGTAPACRSCVSVPSKSKAAKVRRLTSSRAHEMGRRRNTATGRCRSTAIT